MNKPHFLNAIYQHPLLQQQQLETLCHAHDYIEVKRGNLFVEIQQQTNAYYILEKGLARSFVFDYNGNDITTQFFTPGDIVIEAVSLFQRVPAIENIVALTDCNVWKINFDTFQTLFHSIPALTEWGRLWMAKSMFIAKYRSVQMITETAASRYLKLMAEHPEIIQQAPLKHIATYLGITDTSLSRIRKEIQTAL